MCVRDLRTVKFASKLLQVAPLEALIYYWKIRIQILGSATVSHTTCTSLVASCPRVLQIAFFYYISMTCWNNPRLRSLKHAVINLVSRQLDIRRIDNLLVLTALHCLRVQFSC